MITTVSENTKIIQWLHGQVGHPILDMTFSVLCPEDHIPKIATVKVYFFL